MSGLLLMGLSACKKDKTNLDYDYRPNTETIRNSFSRLVNLSGYNQVQVNGQKLTNYIVPKDGNDLPVYAATKYFTVDGRLGSTWSIAQDLLTPNGKTSILVESKGYPVTGLPVVTFDVNDDGTPRDYFLMRGPVFTVNEPLVYEFPRDITTPSKPDHFKIRIINLTGQLTGGGGGREDLVGPLSLSYADGTLVSDKTKDIRPGQKSDYIEIPYGTYQFKVLSQRGTQVPATGGSFDETLNIIDPATSTLVRNGNISTKLTYAPIRTYQPGGVYTIVIYPDQFKYNTGQDDISMTQNGFKIISDISESQNITYSRFNAVNTLAGKVVNISLDGKVVAQNIAYTKSSDTHIAVHGTHKLSITDVSGAVIAAQDVNLRPGENYSFWVYTKADGKIDIATVSNNLSGTNIGLNPTTGEDDTYNRLKRQYPFDIRFLNLSTDVPYLTFTLNDGQNFPIGLKENVVQNLQPGYVPIESPYVRFAQTQNPYKLMAYRSMPGAVPGAWITQVPMLNSADFIARPELYTSAGRALPSHESGIYTVALIGNTSSTSDNKARMIIVKHTK